MNHRDDRMAINLVAGLLIVAAVVAATLVILHHGPRNRARRPGPNAVHLAALPFARDSVWNARLASAAALSADSSTYVHDLMTQVAQKGTYINTTAYSVPVYVVPAGQPRVPVTLGISGPGSVGELAAALRAGVPIPRGARPAAGTDHSMVVWQPSSNTLWETWQTSDSSGRWRARWGGRMTDVSGNPGYFDEPSDWGASATSLSLLGGLITPRDLRAGAIDHALALAIPEAQAHHFVFPAQRTDGRDPSSTQIPEGTRFRLPADLDIASLHLPPFTAMIARAVQRYGMIVRDQSGAVSMYAECPSSIGRNPWTGPRGAFGGLAPSEVLSRFPWARLQVIAPAEGRP